MTSLSNDAVTRSRIVGACFTGWVQPTAAATELRVGVPCAAATGHLRAMDIGGSEHCLGSKGHGPFNLSCSNTFAISNLITPELRGNALGKENHGSFKEDADPGERLEMTYTSILL